MEWRGRGRRRAGRPRRAVSRGGRERCECRAAHWPPWSLLIRRPVRRSVRRLVRLPPPFSAPLFVVELRPSAHVRFRTFLQVASPFHAPPSPLLVDIPSSAHVGPLASPLRSPHPLAVRHRSAELPCDHQSPEDLRPWIPTHLRRECPAAHVTRRLLLRSSRLPSRVPRGVPVVGSIALRRSAP